MEHFDCVFEQNSSVVLIENQQNVHQNEVITWQTREETWNQIVLEYARMFYSFIFKGTMKHNSNLCAFTKVRGNRNIKERLI